MSPLRASIVILSYNYAQFLSRSIQSALNQDYPWCEVIIVDDCSTDSSRDIIREFGDRVSAVLQPTNKGHGAGMNAGFARSSGEIVVFLDSDDYLYPSAVQRIVQNRREGVAQYQFRLDLVDAEGWAFDHYPPLEFGWDDGDVRATLLSRGRYATTVTSGLAFARPVLEAILPMDEGAFRMGGDGYLATVAPLYGTVCTIEEVLGAYCQHGANHSQFATSVAKRARWRIKHDEMRLDALHDHAGRLGLRCEPEPWRNDAFHLEERMASLLLDPQEHPYPFDTRRSLARSGLAAMSSLPVSAKRRRVMQIWWSLVGYGPLSLARRAVAWKLQAATRPAFVRLVARALRRATGKRVRLAAPRPVAADALHV